MKQEDKELLLKDLCARLPYGVKVSTFTYNKISGEELDSIETLYSIDSDGYITTDECDTSRPICKPYLFPISSMTKEQEEEYKKTIIRDGILTVWTTSTYEWFNKNHFDYRRLIPKGLAKDATKLNIY